LENFRVSCRSQKTFVGATSSREQDQDMKFQAPVGLTAISCAGETFAPDENGVFVAAESLATEFLAHGCVPSAELEERAAEKVGEARPRARARSEKAH
jgi:hypothetical protein